MIKFENTFLDLGEIKRSDIPFHKIIEIKFKYINESQNKYVIDNISSPCGCTIPEYKKEIEPFQNGEILLKFNTNNYFGEVQKSVSVTLKENSQIIKLTFKIKIK